MCVKYPPCRQSAIVLIDPRVKIKSCALFTFSCCSASLCHSSWNKVGQSWRRNNSWDKIGKNWEKIKGTQDMCPLHFLMFGFLVVFPALFKTHPTNVCPTKCCRPCLGTDGSIPLVTSCAKVDSLDLASIFYWPFFYWPGCHFGCGKGRWCAGLDNNCDEGRNWLWEGWNWLWEGQNWLWEGWNWVNLGVGGLKNQSVGGVKLGGVNYKMLAVGGVKNLRE